MFAKRRSRRSTTFTVFRHQTQHKTDKHFKTTDEIYFKLISILKIFDKFEQHRENFYLTKNIKTIIKQRKTF